MTKPENPPAFPIHGGPDCDPRNRILQGGLTIREWFAGKALVGYLTNPDTCSMPATIVA
jgi:hypothetical protein